MYPDNENTEVKSTRDHYFVAAGTSRSCLAIVVMVHRERRGTNRGDAFTAPEKHHFVTSKGTNCLVCRRCGERIRN